MNRRNIAVAIVAATLGIGTTAVATAQTQHSATNTTTFISPAKRLKEVVEDEKRWTFEWIGDRLATVRMYDKESSRPKEVITLLYTGHKIMEVTSTTDDPDYGKYSQTWKYLWEGDRIVGCEDRNGWKWEYAYSNGKIVAGPGEADLTWEGENVIDITDQFQSTTYEYDNKHNPLHYVGLENSYSLPCGNTLSASNVTVETMAADDGVADGEEIPINTTTYSYTYDADGFPTAAIITNPEGEKTRRIYTYY